MKVGEYEQSNPSVKLPSREDLTTKQEQMRWAGWAMVICHVLHHLPCLFCLSYLFCLRCLFCLLGLSCFAIFASVTVLSIHVQHLSSNDLFTRLTQRVMVGSRQGRDKEPLESRYKLQSTWHINTSVFDTVGRCIDACCPHKRCPYPMTTCPALGEQRHAFRGTRKHYCGGTFTIPRVSTSTSLIPQRCRKRAS